MSYDQHHLVVVGGGIAGVAAAYLYQRAFPEHSVLLLERNRQSSDVTFRGIGRGLTGRSAGHRMDGFEADWSAIVKLIGEQAALKLYQESREASLLTDRVIREEKFECGSFRGYWIVDQRVGDFDKLAEWMIPRKALDFPEPELHEGAALKRKISIHGYDAGLYFPDIASFDTPKFLYGLAEAFVKRGGHIADGHEYKGHDRVPHLQRVALKKGPGRYRIRTANGGIFYSDHLILAGGDRLSRELSLLKGRTFTVYTGRADVHLTRDEFVKVSPNRVALSGCDTDLKSGQNPLEGDFLWFSLRQDGYLAMGFGGHFNGMSKPATGRRVEKMKQEVRKELLERFPFLRRRAARIRTTAGGLNTTSNLLPRVEELKGEEGVYVSAAFSGVGLNQSIMAAKAIVARIQGDTEIFDLLARFREGQVFIPEHMAIRSLLLEIGARSPIARDFGANLMRGAETVGQLLSSKHQL